MRGCFGERVDERIDKRVFMGVEVRERICVLKSVLVRCVSV